MKELIETWSQINPAISMGFGETEREPREYLQLALQRSSLFVHCGRVAGWALLSVALAHKAIAQSGRIERGTISSAALAGNLFHDPTNRPYAVYLPPGYAQGSRRYPVFYLLHGFGENLDTHLGEVRLALDTLIRTRQIGEMMAVFVDGQTSLLGAFYRTSAANGDFETYVAQELVKLIDARYRTLATTASRGLCGFSMGGYGAMHLALNFPDTFSVVAAQSGYYDSTDAVTDETLKEIARVNPLTPAALASKPEGFQAIFAFLPSAVPNPSRPPFFYDPPYRVDNGQYATNLNTLQRLRDADIVHGDLGRYLPGTTRLRGIQIVHGRTDSLIPISQARTLQQAFLRAGLDHVYEEHAGRHQFLADRSLPFLSQALVGTERYLSPPRLTLTATGAETVIRFSTQAGVDYRIEHTTTLDATTIQWAQFEPVKGTGQVAQIAMPINALNGFFRVSASNAEAP